MKYLAAYGLRLLSAGYEILPIAPGRKFPVLRDDATGKALEKGHPDQWQRVQVTPALVKKWISNGHALDGVGIRAAHTPAIDIDVTDEAVTEALAAWCQANVGMAPERVGRAPKRLLVYRTETPFTKLSSVWIDLKGNEQKVEILGDGQQFVAFHTHPETRQPYQWLGADSLLTLSHDDLEPLTPALARAALAEFDRLAAAKGWRRKENVAPPLGDRTPRMLASDDDALAYEQDAPDISDEALRAYLMAIPDADDYDQWVHVGMALHHHYQGTDDGLELWREWSERSGKYDAETLDRKWPSLKAAPGRPVKTARYIIMLGKAAGGAPAVAQTVTLGHKERLARAATLDDLRRVAAEVSASRDLDMLGREALEGALRSAYHRIEGTQMGVRTAKAMLRAAPVTRETDTTPNWLKDWVFLAGKDRFYHTESGEELTKLGFDSRYNRYMLTAADAADGKAVPSLKASDFATVVAKIPAPYLSVYMPGEDREFTLAGQPMINAYRDVNVPVVPETLTARDRRNVQRVADHFKLLIPDDRERGIVLSFLAHPVKTLGRVNYALVIQGTEGDGKSFLMPLLGAVCGSDNVKVISPSTMSHGSFTAFAKGALVGVVEEIKLHGHNRFDVLNAIKPLITNAVIEVHGKGENPVNVPNTMSYILLTNFADALPIGDHDSRYFIVNSYFQDQRALVAFKALRPTYYDELFAALDESPGALRGWLLSQPVHPEFKPKARAPWSRGHDYMAGMAQSEETGAILATLEECNHPAVRDDLLDQLVFTAEMERVTETVMTGWQVSRQLAAVGFKRIGRYSHKGKPRWLWSRKPLAWEYAPGEYDRGRIAERLGWDEKD